MTARTATGTYLDRILENTALVVEKRKRSTSTADLLRAASQTAPAIPLANGLRGTTVHVIAEFKRASPSKGPIAFDAMPEEVAREYLDGGAAAISVLTDERFFDGRLADLRCVAAVAHRSTPPAPVLRKDFVIDPFQIVEARAYGADAVLLIVAALDDATLGLLLSTACDLGMDALVEVHDESEMERALAAGARLIGINNRDLRSFQVNLEVTERLASLVPADTTLVGESGIRTRQDVERLGRAGIHAVLVGESLMRAPDRTRALKELIR